MKVRIGGPPGQVSWWIKAGNNLVVAASPATFDTVDQARSAAGKLLPRAVDADIEVHLDGRDVFRWTLVAGATVLVVSGESGFNSRAAAHVAAQRVRTRLATMDEVVSR